MNSDDSFHNTVNLKGPLLRDAEKRARSQEDRVLEFFAVMPNEWLTVAGIHVHVMPHSPYASVQRAISNLTRKGHLEKSAAVMYKGPFGVPVHGWRFLKGKE